MHVLPRTVILSLLALAVASAAPFALAQEGPTSTTGDDNEFGIIRMPYQGTIEGQAVTLESRVVIRSDYADQDPTYYMFAWSTEDAPPLSASFVSLTTANGSAIQVFDQQGIGTNLEKWFVDVKDMPPVGTEIVLTGKVEASSKGFYPVATLVVPFNYRWEQITMSSGDQAKLYAFTNLGVNAESTSGKGSQFGRPGGGILPVPAPAALGVVVAAACAVALAARRR